MDIVVEYRMVFLFIGVAAVLLGGVLVFGKRKPSTTSGGLGGVEENLVDRLEKPRHGWVKRLTDVLRAGSQIDDALYGELEETLITADIGVNAAQSLLQRVREVVVRKDLKDPLALRNQLKAEILHSLEQRTNGSSVSLAFKQDEPVVLFMVGVNGVGKTTTIGKLAAHFVGQGKKVLLAAADTFRAAAVEQLQIWGERAGVEVIGHKGGKDPSAVVFDASEAAVSRHADLLIVDTAGRLHTKVNLMEELKKMCRTVKKNIPTAPHEIWLVLDATTGQNALQQARTFHEELGGLTGIVLTKLDGTAKGGVLIGLVEDLGVPVRYIGVGEKQADLRPFESKAYVEALFTE